MTVQTQDSCEKSQWKEAAQVATLCALRAPSRARQQRWDAKHIRTASTRLTIEENNRFKAACKRKGVTRYQVLRYMISLFVYGESRERGGRDDV